MLNQNVRLAYVIQVLWPSNNDINMQTKNWNEKLRGCNFYKVNKQLPDLTAFSRVLFW